MEGENVERAKLMKLNWQLYSFDNLLGLGTCLAIIPARSSSLDLAGSKADNQVGDEAILSLARPDIDVEYFEM